MRFKAVIFDMDGTITVPALDFKKIRAETGILSGDLIEEIARLDEAGQKKAWAIIERHEENSSRQMKLQPRAGETIRRLRQSAVKMGLVTRNTTKSVRALVEVLGVEFSTTLTREHKHVKPSPEPILFMLREWGVPPGDTLVVGDHSLDIESGRRAGALTCFFHNQGAEDFSGMADYSVRSFEELERLLFA